jgi:hypothetical protein
MPNDSTASGYLVPSSPPPDSDIDLEDIFHDLVVGIVGLTGDLVRPRWQTFPANTPDPQEVNWASFGVEIGARQWDAVVTHDPNANGNSGESSVAGSVTLRCNFSFYGINSQANLGLLRDGIALGQNRDVLESKGIKFIEWADPVNLPSLVKNSWARRVDLKGTFVRLVTRTYGVRNIASATVDIDNERYHTIVNVTP